uniref:Cadherin domain-containing protein n=1 Tax=Magallana gigas TaxID=29159 RepID=A0A8W8I309_MAGGI
MWTCSTFHLQTIVLATNLQFIRGNSFAPEILSANVDERIPENTKFGVTVATVTASDKDTQFPDNDIRFRMFASQLASNYLAVDSLTGNIFVKKDLTLETSSVYQLFVQAYDMGSPSKTSAINATVTINIYRNLRDPFFSGGPFAANIPETTVIGTSVLRVNFGDSDTDAPFNTVTVSAFGDDKALTYFRLDSTGQIVVNSDLKADSDSKYLMRMFVQDGGSPPRTATAVASITVQRNINSPVFERQSYNETILETRQLGLSFLQVKATDGDTRPPNNQFKYSITGDTTAMTYFYINPDSGRISLKQPIKGTGINQFRLQLTATDEGTPSLSGQAIVTVDVTIDDTLRFTQLQPYTASIDENDPVDRRFIAVIATPQPNIKYSIVGFSDSPDYFKIDETTGVISVKTDLRKDLSKRTTYLIQVRAEKQFPNGPQSVENLVNVTVLRNINAPVFNSTQYQGNINEKYGLGQSVVQVFATDLNTRDVLLYSIIDKAGETEPFYMAPSTGIITLKQLLTGTTKTRYAFTVRVRDQSKPEKFGQSTVIILVRRNSQSPVFERTPYGAAINFNQAPGPVYTTSARDPDLTGTLTYEVIGYFSAPGYFTVNPNREVVLMSSLASDTAQSYTLGLTAYDSDYPNDKAYANVTITVNRNPNAPDFTNPSYSITVNESYPLAVSLLQVSGQDADQHVVEYILESSNPIDGTQFFYLNPSTGVLTVSRPLTETRTQTFTLQVGLKDNGIPARSSATTAPVTIFITRNNNGPIFAGTFTTSINEITPTNTAVLTVTATDSDPNTSPYGQLRYRIIGDGDFTQFFNIDATTGSILVQRPLTSQDIAFYQGRIVAEDGGSPPRSATATAIINIPRNLNAPVFNPKNYSVTIDETHQVGQYVITVTASDVDRVISAIDDDDGYDGEILFDIQSVSNNGNDKFKIEQDQLDTIAGVICSGTVKRGESYVILVRASDQSFQLERRRHSTVPIEVRVGPFSTSANKCSLT